MQTTEEYKQKQFFEVVALTKSKQEVLDVCVDYGKATEKAYQREPQYPNAHIVIRQFIN